MAASSMAASSMAASSMAASSTVADRGAEALCYDWGTRLS